FSAAVAFLGAMALTIFGLSKNQTDPVLFFGAGALLLIAAIGAASFWMRRQNETASIALPSLRALGTRNIARRRKRSRAVLILLGSGAFIVAAVGVFRLDSKANANDRRSGTG